MRSYQPILVSCTWSYLTVEVLEVASCILLTKNRKKEKKKRKKEISTMSQNIPNNIIKVYHRDLCYSTVKTGCCQLNSEMQDLYKQTPCKICPFLYNKGYRAVRRLPAKGSEYLCAQLREYSSRDRCTQERHWPQLGCMRLWVLSTPGAH